MSLSFAKGRAISIALVLTLSQIGLALVLAPKGGGLGETYARLCQWDCAWYGSIVKNGYRTSIPPVRQNKNDSNVAFFPGYPYLARGVHQAFGVRADIALLIVAQVFCVAFWAALLDWLRRWKTPPRIALLVVLGVLSHPAAFFLVAGYSESLFLSTLLLFILFSFRASAAARWRAVFFGTLMSATRIVGVPASSFPSAVLLAKAIAVRRFPGPREGLFTLAVSLLAASGTFLFFLFCAVRFGRFNLYMETQQIGWGIAPDYWAILKWESFQYFKPYDRYANLASGITFVALPLVEICAMPWVGTTGLRKRVPVYLVAFLIYYFTLSGLKSVNFSSMIRYSLPWSILLGLCLAQLCSGFPRAPRMVGLALWILVAGVLLVSLWKVEVPLFQEFLKGHWVG